MANEKRLISLDEALKATHSEIYWTESQQAAVRSFLVKQPKVDALEVVHGWWIELPSMEPDYKCSECGRSYAWWEPSEAHYCPFCGARMDLQTEVTDEPDFI